MSDIDFDYVRQLDHEFTDVFLDSQMLIEDRIKFAGELPKLLGNFKRLHREVAEAYVALSTQVMHSTEAMNGMERLAAIAEEWPS